MISSSDKEFSLYHYAKTGFWAYPTSYPVALPLRGVEGGGKVVEAWR